MRQKLSRVMGIWKRLSSSEMGIHKRKQESKKTREPELDQESDQENKKT